MNLSCSPIHLMDSILKFQLQKKNTHQVSALEGRGLMLIWPVTNTVLGDSHKKHL